MKLELCSLKGWTCIKELPAFYSWLSSKIYHCFQSCPQAWSSPYPFANESVPSSRTAELVVLTDCLSHQQDLCTNWGQVHFSWSATLLYEEGPGWGWKPLVFSIVSPDVRNTTLRARWGRGNWNYMNGSQLEEGTPEPSALTVWNKASATQTWGE